MPDDPKTPKYGHPPIEMAAKQSSDQFTRPGHFCWSFDVHHRMSLCVAIPCRPYPDVGQPWDGQRWVMSMWTIDHKNYHGAQWKYNGNLKKPTLRPSLHAVGIWHGYVRDGKLVEA